MKVERGGGRTLWMVRIIPAEGAIVVVHNVAIARYIRDMIRSIHGNEVSIRCAVLVVRDVSDTLALRGSARKILVDHAFWDRAPREAIVAVSDIINRQTHEQDKI